MPNMYLKTEPVTMPITGEQAKRYAVSQVVGFINGKSAIHIARQYSGWKKNFTGQHFWARGYHVSTVGRDEEAIREYIKEQEREARRIDQLNLFR